MYTIRNEKTNSCSHWPIQRTPTTMLTKKQISELPKGEYTNSQLHEYSPKHGNRYRFHNLPVDRFGDVVFETKKIAGHKRMLLGRSMHKRFQ